MDESARGLGLFIVKAAASDDLVGWERDAERLASLLAMLMWEVRDRDEDFWKSRLDRTRAILQGDAAPEAVAAEVYSWTRDLFVLHAVTRHLWIERLHRVSHLAEQAANPNLGDLVAALTHDNDDLPLDIRSAVRWAETAWLPSRPGTSIPDPEDETGHEFPNSPLILSTDGVVKNSSSTTRLEQIRALRRDAESQREEAPHLGRHLSVIWHDAVALPDEGSSESPSTFDAEDVAPAVATLDHALAGLFLRLGPPPDPCQQGFAPVNSGDGGAQA
ncbi:hypothetical protein [Streptomyces wuyuanensis]|uniref:hypothetical protein n=1 Tax=Streptomyces wuyuanensis TaxID=1196353 RepID=UPI0036C71513